MREDQMIPPDIEKSGDDLAQELWEVARLVVTRTAERPLEELLEMEPDDWEKIIPRVPGVRTFEGDMRHSAIVALTIAMRSAIGLRKMAEVDQAFHKLVVKERDYERVRVDRLTKLSQVLETKLAKIERELEQAHKNADYWRDMAEGGID